MDAALRPYWRDSEWQDIRQEGLVAAWAALSRPGARPYAWTSTAHRYARWAALNYTERREKRPSDLLAQYQEDRDTVTDDPVLVFHQPGREAEPEAGLLEREAVGKLLQYMYPRERALVEASILVDVPVGHAAPAFGLRPERARQIVRAGLKRAARAMAGEQNA